MEKQPSIVEFYRLPECDQTSNWIVGQVSQPSSPSEWFAVKFPEQTNMWGPAFLERVYSDGKKTSVEPAELNIQFFAAALGGEKRMGHKVVFYVPEQTFYFKDGANGIFETTTEGKLQNLVSWYLLQCAKEMPGNINIQPLFVKFREEASLKKIINVAKSILAADEGFFSNRKRKLGKEIVDPNAEPVHRMFIREAITRQPNNPLTLKDAYNRFTCYCGNKGLKPVERRHFRRLIAEVIREEFGIGLRNDLRDEHGRSQRGWKGITCSFEHLESVNRN